MKTILAGNLAAVTSELARTLLFANLMFISGTAALLLMGNKLLTSIGSSIELPETGDLLLVGCAFLYRLHRMGRNAEGGATGA